MNFTGFDWLPLFCVQDSLPVEMKGNCGTTACIFYVWSATPQWHLAELFRHLWPNWELLLWPAYLTFDRWLQWTSSSMTLRLGKQCVLIFSAWGLWKASELPWAFLRQQMSSYSSKHTTVKLGQKGTRRGKKTFMKFYLKRQKSQAISVNVLSHSRVFQDKAKL